MIKEFHERMLSVAKSHGLPEHFKEDLTQDLHILNKYKDCEFVWLLRTSGSALLPLMVGADPYHISHWLHSDHDDKKELFFVHPKKDLIKHITVKHSEKLICVPPSKLSSFMTLTDLHNEVCQVIKNGLNKGVWGIFEEPKIKSDDWSLCKNYYSSTGNHLMETYMLKAIGLRNKFINSQRTSGAR
jgi:hypothetical protein